MLYLYGRNSFHNLATCFLCWALNDQHYGFCNKWLTLHGDGLTTTDKITVQKFFSGHVAAHLAPVVVVFDSSLSFYSSTLTFCMSVLTARAALMSGRLPIRNGFYTNNAHARDCKFPSKFWSCLPMGLPKMLVMMSECQF